jgi:hypothetical protein
MHLLSTEHFATSMLLHTIVGRTIVFTALMIEPYGKAHGTFRGRDEPRKGIRASSEKH